MVLCFIFKRLVAVKFIFLLILQAPSNLISAQFSWTCTAINRRSHYYFFGLLLFNALYVIFFFHYSSVLLFIKNWPVIKSNKFFYVYIYIHRKNCKRNHLIIVSFSHNKYSRRNMFNFEFSILS